MWYYPNTILHLLARSEMHRHSFPCGEIEHDRMSCVFFEAKHPLSLADRDLKLSTNVRNAGSGFVRNLSGYRAVGSTVGTEAKMALKGRPEH